MLITPRLKRCLFEQKTDDCNKILYAVRPEDYFNNGSLLDLFSTNFCYHLVCFLFATVGLFNYNAQNPSVIDFIFKIKKLS